MKKASMVKKSMITGMALAMVIGGSTAAFAHGIEKDKAQDKSGKKNPFTKPRKTRLQCD